MQRRRRLLFVLRDGACRALCHESGRSGGPQHARQTKAYPPPGIAWLEARHEPNMPKLAAPDTDATAQPHQSRSPTQSSAAVRSLRSQVRRYGVRSLGEREGHTSPVRAYAGDGSVEDFRGASIRPSCMLQPGKRYQPDDSGATPETALSLLPVVASGVAVRVWWRRPPCIEDTCISLRDGATPWTDLR